MIAVLALAGAAWGRVPARAEEGTPSLDGTEVLAPSEAGDAPSVGLRALVVPRHQATLSAAITGRIAAMPVRPGETFAKGDALVTFDCARLRAELDAARAEARAAALDLKAKQRQLSFNSIGELEVDLARAEAARATAQVAAVAADADGCVLRAPYDGRVARFQANPFETVKAGEDILEIVDAGTLEVEVIVPSPWLRWLALGQTFRVALDETGTTHDAAVSRIGARVDPASQSVLIAGTFADPPPAARPGMSGQAVFAPPAGGAGRP